MAPQAPDETRVSLLLLGLRDVADDAVEAHLAARCSKADLAALSARLGHRHLRVTSKAFAAARLAEHVVKLRRSWGFAHPFSTLAGSGVVWDASVGAAADPAAGVVPKVSAAYADGIRTGAVRAFASIHRIPEDLVYEWLDRRMPGQRAAGEPAAEVEEAS